MVRSLIRNISYCSFRFVFVETLKGKMKYEKFENSSAPSECMTLPSFVAHFTYFYSVLILIPCYYIVLFDRYKKRCFISFFFAQYRYYMKENKNKKILRKIFFISIPYRTKKSILCFIKTY